MAPMRLTDEYRAWEARHGDGAPCPICGARMQALTGQSRGAPHDAPVRYGVLHDAATHRRRGCGWTGHSTADPKYDGPSIAERARMREERRRQR